VSSATEPLVVFETVHGSTAYGLAREGSDVDLKGVLIGPPAWYHGWRIAPEQVELSPDHVRFELRKFMRLAADANPNFIEMLWAEPHHHRIVTAQGRRLLDARDLFLSKRVAERFGGYALSQLKRIRTHRVWLLDPPKSAPTRAGFSLPESTVIPADQLAAVETLLNEGNTAEADVSPNFFDLLVRERKYKAAQQHWTSYQQWLTGRNVKRSELEAKFGYDTKHAMHLVRLQRMAIEMLTDGSVLVTRPDRDELLAIRDGAWTYETLEAEADRLGLAITNARQTSPLPDAPNEEALGQLCIELIESSL
jgi:uncharacterized protein